MAPAPAAAGTASLKGRPAKGGAPEWHFVDEAGASDAQPTSWWKQNLFVLRLVALLLLGVGMFILVDVRELLYLSSKDKPQTWFTSKPIWQRRDVVRERLAHHHIPEVEIVEERLAMGPIVKKPYKSPDELRPISVGRQGASLEKLHGAAGPVIHPHHMAKTRRLRAIFDEEWEKSQQ